ncbi:MAG TPA: hypothetical protein VKZ79_10470 [Alphaproteobacteria bacterium]|nr:hypothetical protein [Alphaproteobacteria bacterium]
MSTVRFGFSLLCGLLAFAPPARATLTLSTDGTTVQDSQGVTWLADADLARARRFDVQACDASQSITSDCINRDGSMDYAAAKDWVRGMNRADYLGHDNWQLPATPTSDGGCSATGRFGNSFGFGCFGGALGSIYRALGHTAPEPVVSPASTNI